MGRVAPRGQTVPALLKRPTPCGKGDFIKGATDPPEVTERVALPAQVRAENAGCKLGRSGLAESPVIHTEASETYRSAMAS